MDNRCARGAAIVRWTPESFSVLWSSVRFYVCGVWSRSDNQTCRRADVSTWGLSLDWREFWLAVFGKKIIERLSQKALDRGLAVYGKRSKLPGNVFREVRRYLFCPDTRAGCLTVILYEIGLGR